MKKQDKKLKEGKDYVEYVWKGSLQDFKIYMNKLNSIKELLDENNYNKN